MCPGKDNFSFGTNLIKAKTNSEELTGSVCAEVEKTKFKQGLEDRA